MEEPDWAAVLTYHPDYAGRLWTMNDNDYTTLVMHDDGPKPTRKSLEDRWPAIEWLSTLWAIRRQRHDRYIAETDPMFMKAQRGEDGLTIEDWKAAVEQIQAELPYPEEPK